MRTCSANGCTDGGLEASSCATTNPLVSDYGVLVPISSADQTSRIDLHSRLRTEDRHQMMMMMIYILQKK